MKYRQHFKPTSAIGGRSGHHPSPILNSSKLMPMVLHRIGEKLQGTIAQLLSIANHGNAYLSGRLTEDYFPDDMVFKFCEYVKFVDLQSSGVQTHINDFAGDPIHWFEKLKNTKVSQLRVRYISTGAGKISDRMSVAFVGGGGRWLLQAVKSEKSDLWESKWEIGEKDAPEQKIWRVRYGRVARNVVDLPDQILPDAREVKEQLKNSLRKIRDFAIGNDLGNFAECFNCGIEALNNTSSTHEVGGYKILPDNYGLLEHRQLFNAAQFSWVFGGMGSWNDLGFEKEDVQREYELLSDELFNLINLGLLVAANPLPITANESLISGQGSSKKWWRFWTRG